MAKQTSGHGGERKIILYGIVGLTVSMLENATVLPFLFVGIPIVALLFVTRGAFFSYLLALSTVLGLVLYQGIENPQLLFSFSINTLILAGTLVSLVLGMVKAIKEKRSPISSGALLGAINSVFLLSFFGLPFTVLYLNSIVTQLPLLFVFVLLSIGFFLYLFTYTNVGEIKNPPNFRWVYLLGGLFYGVIAFYYFSRLPQGFHSSVGGYTLSLLIGGVYMIFLGSVYSFYHKLKE